MTFELKDRLIRAIKIDKLLIVAPGSCLVDGRFNSSYIVTWSVGLLVLHVVTCGVMNSMHEIEDVR